MYADARADRCEAAGRVLQDLRPDELGGGLREWIMDGSSKRRRDRPERGSGCGVRRIRGASERGDVPLGEAHRDPCGSPADCEADGLRLAKVEHVRRRPAGCAEGVK